MITRGEYYRRVLARFGTLSTLGGVIKDELFRQEAKRRGIALSQEEIAAFVEQRLLADARELGLEDLEGALDELGKIYAQEGLSLDDVRYDYRKQAEQQLLNDKVVKAMRPLDDRALREFYHQTWAQTRYGDTDQQRETGPQRQSVCRGEN